MKKSLRCWSGCRVSQSAKNKDPGCRRVLVRICHSCRIARPSILHRTTRGPHKEGERQGVRRLVEDPDIKTHLLLDGEKAVNKALRQALELKVVLQAARPHKTSTKTFRGEPIAPHRTKRHKQIGMPLPG
jgi:hypothetical protein